MFPVFSPVINDRYQIEQSLSDMYIHYTERSGQPDSSSPPC